MIDKKAHLDPTLRFVGQWRRYEFFFDFEPKSWIELLTGSAALGTISLIAAAVFRLFAVR